MKNGYNFLSSEQPTESQLHQLMKDVLTDVKKYSAIASKRLHDIQLLEIREAKSRFNDRLALRELKYANLKCYCCS
jgi:hypothetical protein